VELGANDQDVAVHAAAHELVGHRQREQESRALRPYIEGSHGVATQSVLQEARGPGERHVSVDRRKDDEIDVARTDLRSTQGVATRGFGQRRSAVGLGFDRAAHAEPVGKRWEV